MNAISKSKLRAVAPKAAAPAKPKVLIFGAAGVGKTWTALDFAACYYIDTEGGANLKRYIEKLERSGGVYLGPDQGALSFDTVLEQVQLLATQKHPYRTLVIDSVSKLFGSAIAQEAERLADAGKKNEFGADKKPAVGAMRRLVSWLTRLDMTVLLIAHQKEEWGLNAKGEREAIGQTFDAWDRLEYELHLCLQVIQQGNNRFAKVRKSRLENFTKGESMPWSYEEFATRYGKETIEEDVKPIELASDEQLAEVRKLLEVVKISDDQEAKWFTAAGVTSWPEMDAEKVDKIISWLKGKLP
jgi:hypothetical protein